MKIENVVIFADFVLISAKMTTLLKEMRIAQLSSQKEWTISARNTLFQVSLKTTETL